ncbi:possible membrane protein [Vibrio ponticus]|nr:possible membrane protein [Vibrio ponticus]
MIKRLSYLFLLLALIAIAALAALYGALRSQYATSLVNYLLNITHSEIQVEQASYTPPLQLTLEGVRYATDDSFYLPKAELWFAATLPSANSIQLDALVIEGANLALQSEQELSPIAQLATRLTTKQLAIKHSDLSWGEVSARNVNVQIEQPIWKPRQGLPFGNIQFAADQLYYQGHALNNLLVDVNYQAQDSTVYGASFEWNGGQISGQAEQYPQGWSLINVTIDGLNLTQTQNELSWLNELAKSGWIRDINSLDILKSNLSYQGIELLNLDLSVEKITPSVSIWQQKQGYLSFNADTLNYQDEQFVAPSATLYFSPNNIEIAELDTDWQQGRVQLQGQVGPDAIQLKNLTISGAKWLDISKEKLAAISHWAIRLPN